MVEYHPISAKDPSRLHQFGPKVLPGIFLSYVLYAGRFWKGDIMVADIEELETPMKGENFMFPVAEGTVRFSGRDQNLRTSTLIRDNPDRGEE